MKKINKALLLFVGGLFALSSCNDWTEMEIKNPGDLTHTNKSEAYYAQLRAYKNSDHQKSFGWFGNWTGAKTSFANALQGLPDSTDFVSLWGNWKNPSQAQLDDLRFVQQKKGTKALICCLVFDIGDQITPAIPEAEVAKGTTWKQWRHKFWGWSNADLDSCKAATVRYANAICDTIDKYGYDGFDIDAEPNYAQPFQTDKELWNKPGIMTLFIETLSKRIGPKSGTGRLLVIDGEPDAVADSLGKNFDYFILQAYSAGSSDQLNSRYITQAEHFKNYLTAEEVAKKIIVCENFEDHASKGGVNFTLLNGSVVPSLLGFAYWTPTYNGKSYTKGGVGSYHMEYEYGASSAQTTYKYLRRAIQIMNPSLK